MVVVIVKVKLQTNFVFLPYRCSVDCDVHVVQTQTPNQNPYSRFGTGSVDGPNLRPGMSQSDTWLLIYGREKAQNKVVVSKQHFYCSPTMSK